MRRFISISLAQRALAGLYALLALAGAALLAAVVAQKSELVAPLGRLLVGTMCALAVALPAHDAVHYYIGKWKREADALV